jgi:hypothetical protein
MAMIVFADTQTKREDDYHVIRIDNLDQGSKTFQVGIVDIADYSEYHPGSEQIGWVALDLTSQLFTTRVVHATHNGRAIEGIPTHNGVHKPIFADMQTHRGSDAAIVGLDFGDETSGHVYIDEDTVKDSETAHT